MFEWVIGLREGCDGSFGELIFVFNLGVWGIVRWVYEGVGEV